jgi:cytochrome c553
MLAAVACSCLNAPSSGQAAEELSKRRTSEYANDLCGICHLLPGSAKGPDKERAPRIAAQQRAYIEAQLNAFRQQSRREPEAYDCMWGLSSALSDDLVVALAGYFASRPPDPGISGDAVWIDKGRRLFQRDGQPGPTPSCAQCHGKDAAGAGATPRLAGQLAPYLNRQLHVIRAKFRASGVMHGAAQELSDDEMHWIAEYLQSL